MIVLISMEMIIVRSRYQNNHSDRYYRTAVNNHATEDTVQTRSRRLYTTMQQMLHRTLFLNHDNRIVGGVPVEDGEFPFFVHPIGMMLCGATLIHPEYVHTFFCINVFYWSLIISCCENNFILATVSC